MFDSIWLFLTDIEMPRRHFMNYLCINCTVKCSLLIKASMFMIVCFVLIENEMSGRHFISRGSMS